MICFPAVHPYHSSCLLGSPPPATRRTHHHPSPVSEWTGKPGSNIRAYGFAIINAQHRLPTFLVHNSRDPSPIFLRWMEQAHLQPSNLPVLEVYSQHCTKSIIPPPAAHAQEFSSSLGAQCYIPYLQQVPRRVLCCATDESGHTLQHTARRAPDSHLSRKSRSRCHFTPIQLIPALHKPLLGATDGHSFTPAVLNHRLSTVDASRSRGDLSETNDLALHMHAGQDGGLRITNHHRNKLSSGYIGPRRCAVAY